VLPGRIASAPLWPISRTGADYGADFRRSG
jgi:hypothetical protein